MQSVFVFHVGAIRLCMCLPILISDQELRVTSDPTVISQFTYYLVNTAFIQASNG